MYIHPAVLAVAALVVAFGAGISLTVIALRGWIKQEVAAEAKRTFTALIGHAEDVVRVKAATEAPPNTLREMAMTLGKLQTELQDARERVVHVMDNGGNWDDTPAQRAQYKKKERPPKKH
jgi:hypothetical protein